MNRRRLRALAILGIALICQLCGAQEIIVAAASDLQSAMLDVAIAQAPLGVTRFRVTSTHAGVFHYIRGLHDTLGIATP